jgi:Response regulator containing a CheY-like receiver domain and an HTH DNA-binding domain
MIKALTNVLSFKELILLLLRITRGKIMNNIKVAVVEDDLIFQKAITNFLNKQSDMIVVGVAANKNDAVALAKSIEIDIILMDINLSGNESDGIIAAMEISQFSNAKIIMLTGIDNASTVMDSFKAGALHYILKENYIEIPSIIRLLHKNETPFKLLINEFSRLKKEEQLQDLSSPEKEIFRLIEQGYTQAEIAQKLYKTQNTIKTQIKSILKKLKVKNTKEAVEKVRRRGLVEKNKECK